MNSCQFCNTEADYVKESEVISYKCGTISGNQEPRTLACYRGYVEKLRKIIKCLVEELVREGDKCK